MQSLKLVLFVGSLRAESVNAGLARAIVELAPADVEITIHPVDDVPFYNGDVEDAGPPASVVALHDAVAAADGVIFVTPEYNSSFPAVTKNIVDWLSRPPKSLTDTPMTAAAATPGRRAGAGVLGHFASIIEHMQDDGMQFEMMGIGSYFDKFDGSALVDDETRSSVADWVERFATFIRAT